MSDEKSLEELFGPVISSYTDDDALEDGILVETQDPVVNLVTRNVYDVCVEPFVLRDQGKVMAGTPGPAAVMKKLIARVRAKLPAPAAMDDDFYAVDASGWKFFVGRNMSSKFTLMFPEDY